MTTETVRRCATIMDGDRHEFLQANGTWGRCGGPRYCRECNREGPAKFVCVSCNGPSSGGLCSHCAKFGRDVENAELSARLHQAHRAGIAAAIQWLRDLDVAEKPATQGHSAVWLADQMALVMLGDPLPAVDGS